MAGIPEKLECRPFSNNGILKDFFAVSINLFAQCLIHPREGTDIKSLGSTRNEIEFAVLVTGAAHFFFDHISGPARIIHFGAVDAAHEGNLSAVFF